MFFSRNLEPTLKRFSQFPVIAVMGPRQSGKTTLVKNYFKDYTFLSFEKPSIREFATNDPEAFLQEYESEKGLILDEFQYVPQILSYIQLEVDKKKRPGYFVLTGSQNFLMNKAITQSLAGRIGILTLLPFSIAELKENNLLEERSQNLIIKGCYPRLYSEKIEPYDFYSSYIHTYVEKDVRQLLAIEDLSVFQKFISLCAGRIGQELNLLEISSASGISGPTAKKWISILEASYILFLLKPYFNNFNKRIVKTPKLYFYDTGLACNLLNIRNTESLIFSPFKGPLFENLIISDFYKQFLNNGLKPSVYFWRDQNGRIEVDAIIDTGTRLTPIEIKSSSTISLSFFDSLLKWNEISDTKAEQNYIIYSGDENQTRKRGKILGWQSERNLIKKILNF